MTRDEAKASVLAQYDESLDLKTLDWNDGFNDCWIAIVPEVRAVIEQLDSLAEVWGDEGVFRRCRDRLKDAVGMVK